jgi:hypothetical protein
MFWRLYLLKMVRVEEVEVWEAPKRPFQSLGVFPKPTDIIFIAAPTSDVLAPRFISITTAHSS